MNIGKADTQMQGLNINAINKSVANKLGKPQAEEMQGILKDTVAISPQGKKQSLIDQLMKQKELIMENKQAAIDRSVENGSGMQDELKKYEQQLKEIDEQIAQLQADQMEKDTKTEENEEGSIYEKPKTKEELSAEQLNNITDLAASADQAQVISSVQDKLDGRVNVLNAEIKSGNGNIEKKLEEVSELKNRSGQLTAEIGEKLQSVNSRLNEMEESQTEIVPEEDIKSSESEETADNYSDDMSLLQRQSQAEDSDGSTISVNNNFS